MSGGKHHFGGGGLLHEFGVAGGGGGNFSAASVQEIVEVGYSWNYLTTTLPVGAARGNLVCLYQFDGPTLGLTDRSGNGHNLTTNRAVVWIALTGSIGINAVQFRTNTTSQGPTGLFPGTTGVFTIEWIWAPLFWSADSDIILQAGAPTEAEADNVTACVRIKQTYGLIGTISEDGGGTNREAYSEYTGPICHVQYGALTREADGVTYKVYQEGVHVDTFTTAAAPTGGAGADVRVNVGGSTSGNDLYAYLSSLRYTKELYTAGQILASYQRVRGML